MNISKDLKLSFVRALLMRFSCAKSFFTCIVKEGKELTARNVEKSLSLAPTISLSR